MHAGCRRTSDQTAKHIQPEARMESHPLDTGQICLALGIANIFIGMYLSSDAYKNIIAQAVVLGGFYIIVMLKNDLEYLLVGCTPAEEEERLKAAHVIGTSQCLCLSKLELVLTCCLCTLRTSAHGCATHSCTAAARVKLMGS